MDNNADSKEDCNKNKTGSTRDTAILALLGMVVLVPLVIIIIMAFIARNNNIRHYEIAEGLFNEGNYEDAMEALHEVNDDYAGYRELEFDIKRYKKYDRAKEFLKSNEYAKASRLLNGIKQMELKEEKGVVFDSTKADVHKIKEISSLDDDIKEVKYLWGIELYNSGDYCKAISKLCSIDNKYKDSQLYLYKAVKAYSDELEELYSY